MPEVWKNLKAYRLGRDCRGDSAPLPRLNSWSRPDSTAAAYRAFVREHASLAYALAYARCGDFPAAQDAAHEALKAYSAWRGLPGRSARKIIETQLALVKKTVSGEAAEPAFSFHAAAKLRTFREAEDVLRSFRGDDAVALVLLFVEGIPEERILSWLDKPAEFLTDLKERLAARLEGWQPAADASPRDHFERALRRHRLSPGFCDAVLSELEVKSPWTQWRLSNTLWILVVFACTAGNAAIAAEFGTAAERNRYGSRLSFTEEMLAGWIPADVALLVLSFCVASFARRLRCYPSLAFSLHMILNVLGLAVVPLALLEGPAPVLVSRGCYLFTPDGPFWIVFFRWFWFLSVLELIFIPLYGIALRVADKLGLLEP